MEKLDPERDGATPNIVEQNVEELKRLFPEIVTEGKVDFDTLREVLGDHMDEREERYSFTWNGKSRARRLAQTPSTGTLRPCPEASVNWDTTQNLFIEGENLEVLKLLQKSYHRKIKMIYIDPPYNTGSDFIYPDDFRDSIANYLRLTGQTDEEGKKLSTNAEASGRFHTDWLNMMHPRLYLARSLLAEDGAICVSIDDHEVANLRKLLDEVFGEENFLANVVWEKKYTRTNDARYFSDNHDHILMYCRNKDSFELRRLPRSEKQDAAYSNPDDDPSGPYKLTPLQAKSGTESGFEHTFPNGVVWSPPPGRFSAYSHERLDQLYRDGGLWFGTDGTAVPQRKTYLSEVQGVVPQTIWPHEEVGHNHEANNEMKELFGEQVFDNPKPTRLLERCIQLCTQGRDSGLVLDFFAGSGTLAQAVLHRNAAMNESSRFILVQLPEPCDAGSQARKLGFETIADIAKDRIRRVIDKMRVAQASEAAEELGSLLGQANLQRELDLGFRVFTLDTSNIASWDTELEDVEGALLSSVENTKPDRSEADVLYELLLKFGLDLAVPMEKRTIADKAIHVIGAGALIVCLADDISVKVVEGIASLKEELAPETIRVVFKDAGFADDVVKTNAVQILHQAGIDDVRSL